MVLTPKENMFVSQTSQVLKKDESQSFFGNWKSIFIVILWIIVLILFLFTYTDFGKLLWPTTYIDVATTISHSFGYILIAIIVFTLVLLFLNKFLSQQQKSQTSSYIIVHPEKQYEKIRKFALEHHGRRLGRVVKVGRSNPSGESSAMPYTLHFLFEILRRGKFAGYCQIDNSLIKDIDVFWYVREFTFVRDTPFMFWHGDAKNAISQRILDSSIGSREVGKVLTHDELDELTGSATE